MITPTPKLKQLVELFPNRELLCARVKIDGGNLAKILHGQRSPSAKTMEKLCLFINWPLSDAWTIVDGTEPTKE